MSAITNGNELPTGMTKPWDGKHWEVQLKGTGPTQYSRVSNGFAVFRSSIREYLAAEHLHALVFIGRVVQRKEEELSTIVTRLAQSWVLFDSFELLASV
ncbi:hypothetical protein EV175_001963 [Coemansia sp. RSA 1933]|nr:hypothetical protein EV175_001963 [Coemansia sp. RSA 1933]